MRIVNGINHVVYFSSTTENTHRFVMKLGVDSTRIPIKESDGDMPVMDKDYLLICPTYGGGVGMVGENSRPVPPQVRNFLSIKDNQKHLMAVIASGNINFGSDFGVAGDVIKRKFGVPYVHRFELLGTPEDVTRVQEILRDIRLEVSE